MIFRSDLFDLDTGNIAYDNRIPEVGRHAVQN